MTCAPRRLVIGITDTRSVADVHGTTAVATP